MGKFDFRLIPEEMRPKPKEPPTKEERENDSWNYWAAKGMQKEIGVDRYRSRTRSIN